MPARSSSPTPAVVGQLAGAADSGVLAGGNLIKALAAVPDPRARRGVRHQITAVVAIAGCAVLAGCRSFAAIGQWAATAPADLLAALGTASVPSESTFRRVLQRLDGDALDTAIGGWAAAAADAPGRRRAAAG